MIQALEVVAVCIALAACGGNTIGLGLLDDGGSGGGTSATAGGSGGQGSTGGAGNTSGGTTGRGTTGGSSTGGGNPLPDGGPPALVCSGGYVCPFGSSDTGMLVHQPYPTNVCLPGFIEVGATLPEFVMGIGCPDFKGGDPRHCSLSYLTSTFAYCAGYRYALIELAAVWCDACRTESVNLSKSTDAWRAKGGVVVSLLEQGPDPTSAPTEEDLIGWISELAPQYLVAFDPSEYLEHISPDSNGFPVNFIVDLSTMMVVWTGVGEGAGQEAQMDQLLGR